MPVKTRPLGVTVVAVLAMIAAAITALSAILSFIALAGGGEIETAGQLIPGDALLWVGIFLAVVAVIEFLVALGLLYGSPVARFIVTVIEAWTIGALFWTLFGFDVGHEQLWVNFADIIIAVLILILLWASPGAREFFRRDDEQFPLATA